MSPRLLIDLLLEHRHSWVTGVADSIFKDFIIALNQTSYLHHVITNNEGESCALAAGYHLATNQIPVVYMQNSGLGNAINPLSSLLDRWVYSIPALLLIGWRAAPGVLDEPQHRRMGKITPDLLSLLDIPYIEASADETAIRVAFQQAQQHFKTHAWPFALLFRPKTIECHSAHPQERPRPKRAVIREDLLKYLVETQQSDTMLVTTTGKTSRELYEIRESLGQDHSNDFLTVGAMGCAASIALGVALQCPDRRIILVDGDGACLMRMEALATIGHYQPKNVLHILIDNNAYESTGAQKTLSSTVNFAKIALACGYRDGSIVDSLPHFKQQVSQWSQGPFLLSVHSFPYSRAELARPRSTPIDNKILFMQRLGALACKL